MRMRNPAAGIESASVSHGDILRLNIISTHNITYGTNELTICIMLFDSCGRLYLATMLCQDTSCEEIFD